MPGACLGDRDWPPVPHGRCTPTHAPGELWLWVRGQALPGTVSAALRGHSSIKGVRPWPQTRRAGVRAHEEPPALSMVPTGLSCLSAQLQRAWLPLSPMSRAAGTGWPPRAPPSTRPPSQELPFPSREIKCFFLSALTAAPSAGLGKLQADCEWGFRPGSQAGRRGQAPFLSPHGGGAPGGWGQPPGLGGACTGTNPGRGAEHPQGDPRGPGRSTGGRGRRWGSWILPGALPAQQSAPARVGP